MRVIGVDVGGTFTDLALWDDARRAPIDVYSWGALMSARFIFGLPLATLYNRFLDHFIRGRTATGAS